MSTESQQPEIKTIAEVKQSIFNDLYRSLFEKVIEDQMIIDYAQQAVVKESKISVRSVEPYQKTKIKFLNGNQFYGDINEQCRISGNGRYLWLDGSLYEGGFMRPNLIEGCGSFKFQNHGASGRYCGNFADGMYHGRGHLTHNLFKFSGNFESGKFHGATLIIHNFN